MDVRDNVCKEANMKDIRRYELAEQLAAQVKEYLTSHTNELWITEVHRLPLTGS